MIHNDDPAVYLVSEPSEDARILTEQAGQHDGSGPAPFWMLAEVATRAHRNSEWVSGTRSMIKRAKRYALASITSAGAALGVFGSHWIKTHDENIAAAQRAADDDEHTFDRYRAAVRLEFDQLHHELDEVRRALLHVGVRLPAPRPEPSSDLWTLPDTVSINLKGP